MTSSTTDINPFKEKVMNAITQDRQPLDERHAMAPQDSGSFPPDTDGHDKTVTITYETFGDAAHPPVLLVMGFGTQLLGWDADFCRMLAARGRYVIRYDNRDCGMSTKFDEHPVRLGDFITAVTSGDFDRALEMAPYSLHDMARDGIDLLSKLGIARAHVVGSSMGGMIAQRMAIDFPDRVLSLTSMMSSTGEQEYGQSTPEAQHVLFAQRPTDREGYVDAAERELVWASRRYGDAAQLRALAASSYDRAYYPAGVPRQLAAMILDGSRAEELTSLLVPTLVIHGLDDTLIDPSGGRRTAELVPGAGLLLIEDMGHDRPVALWPQLVDAIGDHTDVS
jgi:pimeloyl-ACP methyl ester carboxylesterase